MAKTTLTNFEKLEATHRQAIYSDESRARAIMAASDRRRTAHKQAVNHARDYIYNTTTTRDMELIAEDVNLETDTSELVADFAAELGCSIEVAEKGLRKAVGRYNSFDMDAY